MQQYNPYQPSTSNIPPQTIPKTNWVLYTITIIISIVILLLLNGGLTLSASFLGLTSFTTLFVFISLISLVIGLISGFILNKIAKSNKSFLLGTSITSFLCATMVSIYLSVQKKLAEKLATLETEGFGGSLGGLFGETVPASGRYWGKKLPIEEESRGLKEYYLNKDIESYHQYEMRKILKAIFLKKGNRLLLTD